MSDDSEFSSYGPWAGGLNTPPSDMPVPELPSRGLDTNEIASTFLEGGYTEGAPTFEGISDVFDYSLDFDLGVYAPPAEQPNSLVDNINLAQGLTDTIIGQNTVIKDILPPGSSLFQADPETGQLHLHGLLDKTMFSNQDYLAINKVMTENPGFKDIVSWKPISVNQANRTTQVGGGDKDKSWFEENWLQLSLGLGTILSGYLINKANRDAEMAMYRDSVTRNAEQRQEDKSFEREMIQFRASQQLEQIRAQKSSGGAAVTRSYGTDYS